MTESVRFDPFDPARPGGPTRRWALEAQLLFTVFVCNKSARRTTQVLDRLYEGCRWTESPFDYVRYLVAEGRLDAALRACKSGQYARIGKALTQLVESRLDPATCTLEDLERIYGIGQKSSRFFLMYGRGQKDIAVLDTHVLRWLRAQGVANVPRSTPTSRAAYLRLETIFLDLCKKTGIDVQRADFAIWRNGATSGKGGRCENGGRRTGVDGGAARE